MSGRAEGTFRVVVTGSRHWTDERTLIGTIVMLWQEHGRVTLGHGNAQGADRLAGRVAHGLGMTVVPYPVNQALDGPWPAAGHRRNERMLDSLLPNLVLAFRAPGRSNGTDGCIDAARKRRIRVQVVAPAPASVVSRPDEEE